VETIGTTTLHFLGDDKKPKVTISGGEELVANIVRSFWSENDNAVLHLIDRVLEEKEAEINNETTLSSIGSINTIATDTTTYILLHQFFRPISFLSYLVAAAIQLLLQDNLPLCPRCLLAPTRRI
jgi:hypothetical protein